MPWEKISKPIFASVRKSILKHNLRLSRANVLYEGGDLNNFEEYARKNLLRKHVSVKLLACNFTKGELYCRFSSVNFANLFRKPIL